VGKLKIVVWSWMLGAALLSTPALADIPPEDSCMAVDEGKVCDNAGTDADQPGVCQAASCTRATPSGPMTYDCYRCGADGGAGGADGAPLPEGGTQALGGSGNNTAGSTPVTKPTKDDGGCNVAAVQAQGLAGLLAPLIAFGLATARRRRARR
jgi:MYXO-CTERM domain-containing protein